MCVENPGDSDGPCGVWCNFVPLAKEEQGVVWDLGRTEERFSRDEVQSGVFFVSCNLWLVFEP